jgi:hypothetical protein
MTEPLSLAASVERPAPRPGWRRWYLAGLTALTAYSTGVGWQAQLVSYPFFGTVPAEHFAAYHQQYNASIPFVVIIPGFVSFLAGVAFFWTRPHDVPRPTVLVVAATALTSLLATVLWAIPMHDRLDQIGQDAATIESLLRANLLRSLALTAGTVALVWCVARAPRGATGAGP